jgi:hypothetical protein
LLNLTEAMMLRGTIKTLMESGTQAREARRSGYLDQLKAQVEAVLPRLREEIRDGQHGSDDYSRELRRVISDLEALKTQAHQVR